MDGRPLILVVEKNLHDLELLHSHLKTLNLSCICTKQGARAVILAQTHKPDLILLDMMLSDLSCSQIIECLKQDPETTTVPIIASIPSTLIQNNNLSILSGTDDYITKPYDFLNLEIVISRHLNQLSSSN
ncbi:two-component response regulator [Nostoc sp. NIES-4103]|nr:two-component response regulator [Nostoc sp. NIES-4103]